MNAVECIGLHAAYEAKSLGTEREVLKGLSFSLKEGARLSILGSNGSGKSTLLRSLNGMIPTKGSVKLFGKEVKDMKRKEIAADAAVMSQISQLFFSFSVYETVLMGRYLHRQGVLGGYTAEDKEKARECMRRTDVESLADRQLSQLSGGELQRVFLARTFAQDTPILMLDEPTNHLDLKVVAGMAAYLKEWSAEEGHTLIGVYHDIPLALDLADTLLLMKEGKILAFGSRDEILDSGLLEKAYDFDVRGYLRGLMI